MQAGARRGLRDRKNRGRGNRMSGQTGQGRSKRHVCPMGSVGEAQTQPKSLNMPRKKGLRQLAAAGSGELLKVLGQTSLTLKEGLKAKRGGGGGGVGDDGIGKGELE